MPPPPVDIERQHMIQQVVAGRDRGEHLAHGARRGPLVTGALGRSTDHRGFNRFSQLGSRREFYLRFFFFSCWTICSTCKMWLASWPANMRVKCESVSLPRS